MEARRSYGSLRNILYIQVSKLKNRRHQLLVKEDVTSIEKLDSRVERCNARSRKKRKGMGGINRLVKGN